MMPLPPILRRNDKAKALHVPDTRHLLRGAHPRTQHVWKGTFMRSGRRTKASLLDYARAAAIFKTRTHMVATVRGSSSTTRTLSRMQSTPLLAISTTQKQRITMIEGLRWPGRRHTQQQPSPASNGHEPGVCENGALNNQHTKPPLQRPVLFRFIIPRLPCGPRLEGALTRDIGS